MTTETTRAAGPTPALVAGRDRAAWAAAAADVVLPVSLVVDGERRAAADGATFEHVGPRDGRPTGAVPAAGARDVDAAVDAARRAFDEGPWPRMRPVERKERLLAFADVLEAHRDELALLVALEMGKPIADAHGIELRALIATHRWYAEHADKTLDQTSPVGPDALALITREPVGVVGVVTPWNFPLTISGWKIAPALASGCTVVHKPSEMAPFSALRVAELALEAGLPPGVLNVVSAPGREAGEALGRHAGVDALAFTGSTEVGRAFLRYAADSNLKRTWLELGGKSANVVLPDADLDAVVASAAWGVFFNAGQMCTAPSRLIVHEAVADEVEEGVLAAARGWVPGDPLDPATMMGPLASAARVAQVQGHVDRATADGAHLAAGGGAVQRSGDLAGGSWYAPTVLTGVQPGSRLAQEEVFGPVLAVLRARDTEHAVELANDSAYGLAAGLWTRDVSTAHRVSRRLCAGTVWVNCYEEGDLTMPFGGVKASGNGRDKSVHALEKYTELKTTYLAL